MDWYLDSDATEALPLLRRDIVAYLRRHCEADSDLDSAELLVAEAVGNAVRHTEGPVWVSLTWHSTKPKLSVYDLGTGFDAGSILTGARPADLLLGAGARASSDVRSSGSVPEVEPEAPLPDLDAMLESGRGLLIMRALAPSLETRRRSGDGMVISLELPVMRPPAVSHDPPVRRHGVLPSLGEALPEGGFGKESFLRALVVQLAQTVELQHGPDAAEAAVAQVGTDVGGRMEEEFRLARAITGRMTPEEMGECYVRLKHAIEGGFRVVEATPERIVLDNDRCPFGDVVQQAPSLCRMTSSVFGGIAARNSDPGASVVLEERIALGDPGCRVVVYLNSSRDTAVPEAHHYGTPTH